jgi:putative membrane protein insertion efficiency factor
MKYFVLFLISGYRFITQTLHPRCRFQPSCSVYAYQAIEVYGFLKGFYLFFKRIIRCHPFCNGGINLIPPINQKENLYKRKS